MNCLYATVKNQFWHELIVELRKLNNFVPVYWVGAGDVSHLEKFNGCFYHDGWKAFSLSGGIDLNENDLPPLRLNQYSRVEYYNYIKILDRVDFEGAFSFSERDELFKRQLIYWHYVLEHFHVDCVIFSNAPHLPFDYPLYLVAKRLGVATLMFNICPVFGWHYITQDIGGGFVGNSQINDICLHEEEIKSEFITPFLLSSHRDAWYMERQKKSAAFLSNILQRYPFTLYPLDVLRHSVLAVIKRGYSYIPNQDFNKFASIKFDHHAYRVESISRYRVEKILRRARRASKMLRKEHDSCAITIDPRELGDYLYFPLHYQPELTTAPLGDDASDQVSVIMEIAKVIPPKVKLVVKEHPSQFASVLHGYQGRTLGYWSRIAKIPNVILCDLSVSSVELIKCSSAVITVTGTAGWEAIINRKPCIYFGGAWYKNFPQAIHASFENLESAILAALNNQCVPEVTSEMIYSLFIKYAIKNDIHGYGSGDVPKNPSQAAELIKSAFDEIMMSRRLLRDKA